MYKQNESPDIETSLDKYAQRFNGAVGSWMLNTQWSAVHQMLKGCPGREVLDIGGGHAQLTGPLLGEGYNVTVLGSNPSCVSRLTPYIQPGRCRFQVGEILNLPYDDHAFDAVIGIRLMAHLHDWQRFLEEATRVARHTVIIDYPSLNSVNRIHRQFFGLKKSLEGDTRPYQCFTTRLISEHCDTYGFRHVDRRRQFFMPMALHRAMKMPRLSARIENTCEKLGLTAMLGSPVVLKLSHTGESHDPWGEFQHRDNDA